MTVPQYMPSVIALLGQNGTSHLPPPSLRARKGVAIRNPCGATRRPARRGRRDADCHGPMGLAMTAVVCNGRFMNRPYTKKEMPLDAAFLLVID